MTPLAKNLVFAAARRASTRDFQVASPLVYCEISQGSEKYKVVQVGCSNEKMAVIVRPLDMIVVGTICNCQTVINRPI